MLGQLRDREVTVESLMDQIKGALDSCVRRFIDPGFQAEPP